MWLQLRSDRRAADTPKGRTQLASALLAASVFVSGSASAEPPDEPVAAKSRDVDVRASSEVATYADSNHVFVVTPTIATTLANATAGWTASGRYLVDVVSAASVDIVATASRRWQEVRQAGALDGAYRFGANEVSLTGNVSHEPDYDSLMAGVALARDLADRNVTLLLGLNGRHDTIGRTGTPFSVFSRALDILGMKAGSTFVLGRATLLSVVSDVMLERGDPSKPYRYVPMFAPGTVVPRGASIELVDSLRLPARVLEQLPLRRERYAVAGRVAHRFGGATLRLEERVYADSWGLKATTTDTRVLFDVGSRAELGPHLRFHAQTPVEFWQRAYELRPGFDFPALRTGDREIGPLVGFTAGGRLRLFLGPRPTPKSWTLGLDLGVSKTYYLDDLFIADRLSTLGALSLEVSL